MAVTGTTADTLGTTLTTTNWQANHALMRAWVNGGMVIGDLSASAVRRDHMVRPVFQGYPLYRMIGRLQQQGGHHEFDEGAPVAVPLITTPYSPSDAERTWGPARDRDTIHPRAVRRNEPWRCRWGFTTEIREAATITMQIQGTARVHGPTDTYPFNAPGNANNARAGRLAIVSQEGIADPVEYTPTVHYLYPQTIDRFTLSLEKSFTRGTRVSCYLAYIRGTASGSDDQMQVDLRAVQWHWELHYD